MSSGIFRLVYPVLEITRLQTKLLGLVVQLHKMLPHFDLSTSNAFFVKTPPLTKHGCFVYSRLLCGNVLSFLVFTV